MHDGAEDPCWALSLHLCWWSQRASRQSRQCSHHIAVPVHLPATETEHDDRVKAFVFHEAQDLVNVCAKIATGAPSATSSAAAPAPATTSASASCRNEGQATRQQIPIMQTPHEQDSISWCTAEEKADYLVHHGCCHWQAQLLLTCLVIHLLLLTPRCHPPAQRRSSAAVQSWPL